MIYNWGCYGRSMGKTINEWVKEVHEYALEKGWWDEVNTAKCPNCKSEVSYPRPDSEALALIHSEVSEAIEDNRIGSFEIAFEENGKPIGEVTELVDILIRIFDYAGKKGYDLEKVLEMKHAFNKTRPYRHNKRW